MKAKRLMITTDNFVNHESTTVLANTWEVGPDGNFGITLLMIVNPINGLTFEVVLEPMDSVEIQTHKFTSFSDACVAFNKMKLTT